MADTTNTNPANTSTPVTPSGADPGGPGRRYRTRGQTARDHRLTPRFTEAELAAIRAAADAAQMTLTGFCALAALSVARRRPGLTDPPNRTNAETGMANDTATAGVAGTPGALPEGVSAEELAEMQRELFAARVAVNRAGTNLNQAVAQLNATGTAPVWLEHAVARVTKALSEVDAVASRIHHRLA